MFIAELKEAMHVNLGGFNLLTNISQQSDLLNAFTAVVNELPIVDLSLASQEHWSEVGSKMEPAIAYEVLYHRAA
ncbi:hypothetical protein RvY_16253 [Ramazzottius varieornatus]|uniref:Uncharacterized protein n=1 Tax=Ramazzottius varieornatus TaxID=947166 RepID=A0A1D1VXU2_RAMVA|nr:hypothetical protein RvY_16253 [Ramazzottius varieornatus]